MSLCHRSWGLGAISLNSHHRHITRAFFFFYVYFICFAFIHFIYVCLTVSAFLFVFFSIFFIGLQLLRIQFFCYHLKWFLCVCCCCFYYYLHGICFLSLVFVCVLCMLLKVYFNFYASFLLCKRSRVCLSAHERIIYSVLNHMNTEPIQCNAQTL